MDEISDNFLYYISILLLSTKHFTAISLNFSKSNYPFLFKFYSFYTLYYYYLLLFPKQNNNYKKRYIREGGITISIILVLKGETIPCRTGSRGFIFRNLSLRLSLFLTIYYMIRVIILIIPNLISLINLIIRIHTLS